MNVDQAIKTRRTIRFFKQDTVCESVLKELISAARCAPSAANCQPIEYIIINKRPQTDMIFEQLAWAAYIQPKRTPPVDKRPSAYIAVLINTNLQLGRFANIDAAAAIQNMLLAAWNKGIGSCWLGSVNKEKTKTILNIPDDYEIDSVIAFGYPDESPIMEECKNDSIRYYLDENQRLHVPKRTVQSITHINRFGTRLSENT